MAGDLLQRNLHSNMDRLKRTAIMKTREQCRYLHSNMDRLKHAVLMPVEVKNDYIYIPIWID